MEEEKVCKKCNRPLPKGYKYNECENCRGDRAGFVKKVAKGALAGLGTAVSLAVFIIANGKKDGGGKE